MRTALTYLASLFCHATVLTVLANIGTFQSASDYAVRRGSRAVVLQASLAATDEVRQPNVQWTAELPPSRDPPDKDSDVLSPPRQEPLIERNRPDLVEADVAKERPSERDFLPRLAGVTSRDATDVVPSTVEPPLRRATLATAGDLVAVAAMSESLQGAEVQAPQKLPSNPQPPYPADALARGIEGMVELHVCIAADGRVESASIHQSSGVPSFDEAALSTVRRSWRFRPAMRFGQAVRYEAILPIHFTIRAG